MSAEFTGSSGDAAAAAAAEAAGGAASEQQPPPSAGFHPAALAGIGLGVILAAVALLRTLSGRRGSRAGRAAGGDPLARLRSGLAKTRGSFGERLRALFGRGLSDAKIADLEEVLITADMGVDTTTRLIADVKQAYAEKRISSQADLLDYLKKHLVQLLAGATGDAIGLREAPQKPTVVLVAGVNGSGKTTSVGKMTYHLSRGGKKVILAAGDTFRAAAVEQLTLWAKRLGVEIVKSTTGSDPGAVVHDAIEAATARGADYLLIDTAGRLHTQKNLMKELEKIRRVVQKNISEAPHETLLVLDATTGQNAIVQAKEFKSVIDISGIFLAKLDGTAKGGIIVAIRDQLGLPVKFVGLGEQPEDMEPFSADRFVEALLT